MTDPIRDEEGLSSMQVPESPPSNRGGDRAYAAGVPEIAAEPLLPEHGTDQRLGEWPEERGGARTRIYPRLRAGGRVENVGGTVGNVIGNVVQKARQFPNVVQDRVQDLKSRFIVISGRKGQLAETAQQQARRVQTRAQFYARHYPLQFIAGTAAASFLVGFLLRMWRDE